MSSCWFVQASWNTEQHVNRKKMIYNTLFVKLTLLFQEMPLSWNDQTHNNNNNNYWSHLGFKLLTQIMLCKFCECIINSLWWGGKKCKMSLIPFSSRSYLLCFSSKWVYISFFLMRHLSFSSGILFSYSMCEVCGVKEELLM